MRTILPGRPQSCRQALTTVNWDGLRVVAYISGNIIIIFNGRRELLQSISVDEADVLLNLIANEESGVIAVSDRRHVYIYQPYGRDYGDLRWTRVHTLSASVATPSTYLSWGSSDELLVAGEQLTLWNFTDEDSPATIWKSELSSPVAIAVLSPDAGLIASCGHHDRIVKIWRRLSYEQDSTRFDVSYLLHPATVTNLSWRRSWHLEQNLDNLLYSFCSDNQVRIWAHADHHASTTLQQLVSIDTNDSIQPRRLSLGSMSKSRFAFILENRDLARAVERALQVSQKTIDHALEHLVDVANRSPEVCIVLDGKGHMSAWGIENAGLKNKLRPDKFNVALVDGVNIALLSQNTEDDYAQIYAFANNDAAASLCVLTHLHSGQIDWYQGSFVEFFDTAARRERIRLMSCWSGHDAVIDRMVSSTDGRHFLSLTEHNQGILWLLSPTGALTKISELQANEEILDAAIPSSGNFIVSLHPESCVLWNARNAKATIVAVYPLTSTGPKSITTVSDSGCQKALALFDDKIEEYILRVPARQSATVQHAQTGDSSPLRLNRRYFLADSTRQECTELCTPKSTYSHFINRCVFSWSHTGSFDTLGALAFEEATSLKHRSTVHTCIRPSSTVATLDGRLLAISHHNRRTISIWSIGQSCYEDTHTFDDFGDVLELAWSTSAEDEPMLAVQFSYHVAIIAERRYELSVTPAWRLFHVIQTRRYSTHPIGTTCWLSSRQLAISLGIQIVIFEVPNISELPTQPNGIAQAAASITDLEISRFHHSSKPIFSPDYLEVWVATSQLGQVLRLFHMLHQELKFLVSGEVLSLGNDDILPTVVGKAISRSLTNESDAKPVLDLQDVQMQLEENVGKISLDQLTSNQQDRLRSLIRATVHLQRNQQSLDPAAQTYLYYFMTSLAGVEAPQSEIKPLPFSAITFASLSKTQEALLHLILGMLEDRDIKLTWSTARALGLFLFLNDREVLKAQFESVARSEYNRDADTRNPVSCSLFYLALDKKPILQSLWRRTVGVKEKDATIKLLAHDFSEQKWKATALKNAYALLSKRRFDYAAAFFLLGGSLVDAVNVCVNQLHDLQLAIAIARVWERSTDERNKVIPKLLHDALPDLAVDSAQARWLLVWAAVFERDLVRALQHIVEPIDVLLDAQFRARQARASDEDRKRNMPFQAQYYSVNEPSQLLHIFKHIRSELKAQQTWNDEAMTPKKEWSFIMRCVDWYRTSGLDWLALQTVASWEFVERQTPKKDDEPFRKTSFSENTQTQHKSALDDWLEPANTTAPNQAQPKIESAEKPKPKPPTQFVEPSADSLLDSFGF